MVRFLVGGVTVGGSSNPDGLVHSLTRAVAQLRVVGPERESDPTRLAGVDFVLVEVALLVVGISTLRVG
jgi:hypothetical protein